MSLNKSALLSLALATAMSIPSIVGAQQGDGTRVPIATNVFKPDKVQPTADRIASIKAPAGFTVTPFATGLKNAASLQSGAMVRST
jgi:hypothetical protein